MLSEIQIISLIFIMTFFFLSLVGVNSERKTLSTISSNAPTILTSTGIFFTFLGILLALNAFDVANINRAMPKLIDGLKLAFLSSVAGLGCSLMYRFIAPSLNKKAIKQDTTAGDLLSELKSITNGLENVEKALIGDGDSSLSTQISKLRNDFRDFAEKVSEDSSKALIEALEAVIKDFNEKISEQFGENFKQLNEAVGKLLEWQQEYKEQVTLLTEAFISTQEGIADVRTSVDKIKDATQTIPEQMEKIETVFNATDDRMVQLYDGLSSLDEMQKNAEGAVPFIQNQINELTEGLKQSIEEEMELIDKQLETMKLNQIESQNTIKDLNNGLNDFVKESLVNSEKMYAQQMDKFEGVLNSLNMGADNVLESTEKVGKKVEDMMTNFANEQKTTAQEIKRKIDETLADNAENMNQSFQALDKGMQEQLQRSLDKMGNNLASITDRFVESYEQSASKIVDLTSKISRN